MSTQSLKALILASIKASEATLIADGKVAEMAATMPLKKYVNEVAIVLAAKYEVEAHESKQNAGFMTFAKDSAAYQQLKKFRKLHPKNEAATSSSRTEEKKAPKVDAKLVAAIQDLIIASGIESKTQLVAILADVKAGIVFNDAE
jgi:hypothetical protein